MIDGQDKKAVHCVLMPAHVRPAHGQGTHRHPAQPGWTPGVSPSATPALSGIRLSSGMGSLASASPAVALQRWSSPSCAHTAQAQGPF